MKANEAPEKIYVHVRANKELGPTWHGTFIGVHDIEYTRTDAFIEKAIEYISNNMRCDGYTLQTKAKFIKDFKNYMKGE